MRYAPGLKKTPLNNHFIIYGSNRFANSILVYFILLLILILQPVAGFAKDEKLLIPIFYATDRKIDPAVANLSYGLEQLDPETLLYGQKNIVLVNPMNTNERPERLAGLGWASLIDKSSQPSSPNMTMTESNFFRNVKEVVNAGQTERPLVLYVHGCCNDFNSTTTDGARIALEMGAPVIVYAWAAIPTALTKYKENEPAQAKSAKRFNEFLSKLETEVGASRLILIGYSMGNRFLENSLRVRYWAHGSSSTFPKFRATCFMCADVPLEQFQVPNTEVTWNSGETIISKNDTDPALQVSRLLHNQFRIGAPMNKFSKVRGGEHVVFYDMQNILFAKHDLPITLLAQVLRLNEKNYQVETQPYILKQNYSDWFSVFVRKPLEIHTTIKE